MDARIENFHVGSSTVATNKIRMRERQILGKSHKEIEEIWLEVLERIQVTSLKEFMFKEDKLISVSFREDDILIDEPIVFSSPQKIDIDKREFLSTRHLPQPPCLLEMEIN
ncbi:hypothetical protein JHK82_052507 [Glycine max]|nr:hypothetical protein JHK86_052353 [Glycine max]KAG5082358.1 hypothetical protein JHK84_052396 [Glycine max]KAG5085110.1 hypothetical protein JHK82_052507 [Glycine max]